ncbi:MAG: late control gene D protein [Bacteriophage sp.]|nr:MAG: late control gene D protein [Bacteriophage sp.]
MINSNLKEKYWDSGTDKQMVISVVGTNQKIDNSMLEVGTFSLEESLCSESELKFGACEANCVKFTARNTAGSINGRTISISETVDGDSENPMLYGVFKVASDVPTADRTKRQITAYDAMYDIINSDVKAWYAGLSFPMTLKQFRDSFFAHLGIAQVETSLINDSMTVNKTIVATQTDDSSVVTEESSISGKTVVTAICEINGCFGNINRDGKFEYVFLKAIASALYPAEDLFPSDNLFPSDANTESMTGHYITFDYEDFQSKAITQLEIKTSEDNAGAIVGTAGNNYSITGNFLVSDKTGAELEQIANNLLPIMKQAVYTPIKSCTCVGNPCLTLGEPIRFNTTREIAETYLLQRTLTGVQSKRDSISAQGTQTHSAKVNSIRDTIESVERRTGKLERNADHLQSTYEDLEEQTNTKFEQTTKSIVAEVNRAQKAEGQLDASLELKLGRDENDQVISMINASADQIVLRGNRLIVECNNFELDGSGRVHIIESLLFDSGEVSGVEILGHDGRNNALLQNVKLDLLSVTDANGENLATESYVDNSLSDYATKSELPSGYFTDVDYTLNDSSTTKYSPRHFNKVSDFGSRESTLDIEGLLISIPSSDKRLKNNIQSLRDIKSVYMAMRPVEYTWKSGYITQHTGLQFGLIAQDLEKILQDAGLSDSGLVLKEDAEEDEKAIHGDLKTWKIDKENLHAMHIQMIQMQQKEIELLQQKNEDLERRLSALERSVSHAENI